MSITRCCRAPSSPSCQRSCRPAASAGGLLPRCEPFGHARRSRPRPWPADRPDWLRRSDSPAWRQGSPGRAGSLNRQRRPFQVFIVAPCRRPTLAARPGHVARPDHLDADLVRAVRRLLLEDFDAGLAGRVGGHFHRLAPSGAKPAGGPPMISYRTRQPSHGDWFECRVTVVVKTCRVPAGLIAGGGNCTSASTQWTIADFSRASQLIDLRRKHRDVARAFHRRGERNPALAAKHVARCSPARRRRGSAGCCSARCCRWQRWRRFSAAG